MIKTLIKAMYSAFISIVLVSIILAGWTTYSFIFKSSKSVQIASKIQDMYASQKSFFIDLIDLSKILISDTSMKITNENKVIFGETELEVDIEEESKLDQSLLTDDNGDNPLGIVIQPSLSESTENLSAEIIEDPLVNEQNEVSMSEMEILMEMNS
mgnify:CR=1 FL=1|tara:strand:- start:45 stop:512 length:468 start_codon:yes stop_codon:yes gene_type:complete